MAQQAIGAGITALSSILSRGSSNSARALRDQYTYNLDLQNRQNDFTREQMLNKYQWQVQDLKKAGINPLYGLGNAPIGSSGMASVGLPDYAGEVNGKKTKND